MCQLARRGREPGEKARFAAVFESSENPERGKRP